MVQNVFATSATTDNCSRHDLLAFVNDCLQANFTRIEEMSTGAAYCQLTDFLFRGKIQLKKVKWNSKNETDWISNWRLLQISWKDIGVEKAVPVERLLKGKFQDNFEFLQWFKKFFDANCTDMPYDPIAARNGQPLPASVAVSNQHRIASSSSSRIATKKCTNNDHSKLLTTATSIASSKPSTTNTTAALLHIEQERCRELKMQLDEAIQAVSVVERERNFYYSKLQKVEEYCQSVGETSSVKCETILQILYETEDGFAIPETDGTFQQQQQEEEEEQNGTATPATTTNENGNAETNLESSSIKTNAIVNEMANCGLDDSDLY